MANRHTLHVNKIDDFKEWLIKDGWSIQSNKGYYEALRAVKNRRTLIVYFRSSNRLQHYSVSDKDAGVVRAYLRDKKGRKNETDLRT